MNLSSDFGDEDTKSIEIGLESSDEPSGSGEESQEEDKLKEISKELSDEYSSESGSGEPEEDSTSMSCYDLY